MLNLSDFNWTGELQSILRTEWEAGQGGAQGTDQRRDSRTSTPTQGGILQIPPLHSRSRSQDSFPSDDGGH